MDEFAKATRCFMRTAATSDECLVKLAISDRAFGHGLGVDPQAGSASFDLADQVDVTRCHGRHNGTFLPS